MRRAKIDDPFTVVQEIREVLQRISFRVPRQAVVGSSPITRSELPVWPVRTGFFRAPVGERDQPNCTGSRHCRIR